MVTPMAHLIPNRMKRAPLLLFCLLMACLVASCSAPRTIVNQLDEKEANEIIVFLARKGITATKIKSTGDGAGGGTGGLMWDVQVAESEAIEAMAILNTHGLPRRRGQNLLGIFEAGGLVPSEMQERVKFQQGLAEQIASTIRKIDGILDADVQLSFPEEDIFNPEANKDKRVSASVYVKHSGVMDDPNALLETKIKRLVASSIQDLEFENVAVIADRAKFSGDTTLIGNSLSDEKDYVSVWSIVLAKESVSRFRLIFFSFTLLIVGSLLSVAWMLFKFLPVISELGFGELFQLSPITPARIRGEGAPSPAEEEEEEEEEELDEDDEDDEEKV